MLNKITIKQILIFLTLSSTLALLLAYISQYFFGLKPCELCLWQRKPYFIIIFLAIFGLFFKNSKIQKIIIALCCLAIISSIAIAFYHVGVEKKIFAGLEGCKVQNLDNIVDIEALKIALKNSSTAKCSEVAFEFLSISMAGWNLIYNLFLLILLGTLFYHKKN